MCNRKAVLDFGNLDTFDFQKRLLRVNCTSQQPLLYCCLIGIALMEGVFQTAGTESRTDRGLTVIVV